MHILLCNYADCQPCIILEDPLGRPWNCFCRTRNCCLWSLHQCHVSITSPFCHPCVCALQVIRWLIDAQYVPCCLMRQKRKSGWPDLCSSPAPVIQGSEYICSSLAIWSSAKPTGQHAGGCKHRQSSIWQWWNTWRHIWIGAVEKMSLSLSFTKKYTIPRSKKRGRL
jgi:hypothetical protein